MTCKDGHGSRDADAALLLGDGSHNFVANDFFVHNSTLCSQADSALFVATEAGLNALEVYQTPVKNWAEFLAVCREVTEPGHRFRTIVFDTLDSAYRVCSEFVCGKHKIEHESDLGYGNSLALVNSEFYRVLNKLSLSPYGHLSLVSDERPFMLFRQHVKATARSEVVRIAPIRLKQGGGYETDSGGPPRRQLIGYRDDHNVCLLTGPAFKELGEYRARGRISTSKKSVSSRL